MTGKPGAEQEATASLESAIDKAKEVAAEIQQAADNLAVVNTVLQDQIPDEVQAGEVAQALDQNEQVEKIITRSAETLEAVNDELEKATAVSARRAGQAAGAAR